MPHKLDILNHPGKLAAGIEIEFKRLDADHTGMINRDDFREGIEDFLKRMEIEDSKVEDIIYATVLFDQYKKPKVNQTEFSKIIRDVLKNMDQ